MSEYSRIRAKIYGYSVERKEAETRTVVEQPEAKVAVPEEEGPNLINGFTAPSKAYLRKQAAKAEVNHVLQVARQKNALTLFQQAAVQRSLEEGLAKKMRRARERAEAEERANVYGFQRQLLQSPTSVSMLNSFALKKADV